MLRRERIAAFALMVIGGVLVAGVPSLVGETLSRELLLGLSVVGGGILWGGVLWDDTICRRGRDERQAEIHYRAGYNTAIALFVLIGMVFSVAVNLDAAVPTMSLWVLTVAGLVVYFGSVVWLKRRM
jgi:hypothetical protein